MGSKYKSAARRVIDQAPKMESANMPDSGDNGRNIEPSASIAIYRIIYMVYVPESSKGRGVIQIEVPNKKEYNRVRRQIRRKSKIIKFTNAYGEPHIVMLTPNMLSLTVEKYEVKPGKPGEKSRIILPTADAVSAIQ